MTHALGRSTRADLVRLFVIGGLAALAGVFLSIPLGAVFSKALGMGTHGFHVDFIPMMHFYAAVLALTLSTVAWMTSKIPKRPIRWMARLAEAGVVGALADIMHAAIAYHREPMPEVPFEAVLGVIRLISGLDGGAGDRLMFVLYPVVPLVIWFAIAMAALAMTQRVAG